MNVAGDGTDEEFLTRAETLIMQQIEEINPSEYKSYKVDIWFERHDWDPDTPRKGQTSKGWCWYGWFSDDKQESDEEEDKTNNHMWTIELGDPNLPKLVLIHGYDGSGLIFYRMFQDLSRKFHVLAVDLLMMGRSSTPKFEGKNQNETFSFLVQSLEKWRRAIGISKFSLLGHSFGGYVASRYALEYPQNVEKLLLISPILTTRAIDGDDLNNFQDKYENLNCAHKALASCAICGVGRLTKGGLAHELARTTGGYAAVEEVNRTHFGLHSNDFPIFNDYVAKLQKKNDSSDKVIDSMFSFFILGDYPITKYLKKIVEAGIEVLFYFGSKDTNPFHLNGNSNSAIKLLLQEKAKVRVLNSDQGKYLMFGSTEELVTQIIQDFEYEAENED